MQQPKEGADVSRAGYRAEPARDSMVQVSQRGYDLAASTGTDQALVQPGAALLAQANALPHSVVMLIGG